jgi:hypothetical protein
MCHFLYQSIGSNQPNIIGYQIANRYALYTIVGPGIALRGRQFGHCSADHHRRRHIALRLST